MPCERDVGAGMWPLTFLDEIIIILNLNLYNVSYK